MVAYDDVLDIGWGVWGTEWDFDLDHLTASFTNPALDPDDPLYRVWGHVFESDGSPSRVDGESVRGTGKATLEADDISSGTGRRAARDDAPRSGRELPGRPAPKRRGPAGHPRFRAEADRRLQLAMEPVQALRLQARLPTLARDRRAGPAVQPAADVAARERDTGVPEYLPGPPDDATPAVAYGLAHEGGNSPNTALATLLDLVDRGYYETSQATTDDEKLDLALKQKDERPDGELTDYEQDVLAFFDQLLDGRQVAMSEMKDQIPEHSEVWRGRWERMTEKARRGRDRRAGLGPQPHPDPSAERPGRGAGDRAGRPDRSRGEQGLDRRRHRRLRHDLRAARAVGHPVHAARCHAP